MAGLELPFGVFPVNPVYVDGYRGPYVDVATAIASVPEPVRVQGQVVFISGLAKEYWWETVTTDVGLVEKVSGAANVKSDWNATSGDAEILNKPTIVNNIPTDLSLGPISSTALDINSSDGNNVTVPSATGTFAGLMPSSKFNEVVANNAKVGITPTQASDITTNNAKVTNATHTGDVTGSGALTISNNAVTNVKAADIPTLTLKGRVTAGTGDPQDLTGTEATTILDTFTSTLKGLVPASGGGTDNFLRADGTWSPAGGGVVKETIMFNTSSDAPVSDWITLKGFRTVDTASLVLGFKLTSTTFNVRASLLGTITNVNIASATTLQSWLDTNVTTGNWQIQAVPVFNGTDFGKDTLSINLTKY